ncbi:MAG: hypothetical protein KAS70_00375 [Planctomycetes bacterium]|nr:hypothetical protein [Planctomycetota bacterium]
MSYKIFKPILTNGWKHNLIQLWGKTRRAYLVYYHPAYVKKNLRHRVGECHRCGTCCKLMFDCWWLNNHCQTTGCRHYSLRSRVCHIFPIDERDLKDRDLLNPTKKCGYSFNGTKTAKD